MFINVNKLNVLQSKTKSIKVIKNVKNNIQLLTLYS